MVWNGSDKKHAQRARTWAIWCLWVVIAIVLILVVAVAGPLLVGWFIDGAAIESWLVKTLQIEQVMTWARQTSEPTRTWLLVIGTSAQSLVIKVPWIVAGFYGVYRLRKRISALATRVYDGAFRPFDTTVLGRIPEPKAFDPLRGMVYAAGEREAKPLIWTPPDKGPRKALWDALVTFTRDGDGAQGRRSLVSFRYIVVHGETGSGKSRLAVEFCRHMACQDRFGGDKSQKSKLAQFCLRVPSSPFPWRWRYKHLWDAGWLIPKRRGNDERFTGCPVEVPHHARPCLP